MATTLLQENITRYGALPPEQLAQFLALFNPLTISKKGVFLREGDVCEREAFVTKGLFRVYYTDNQGVEQVLYFAMEDWWLTDIDSFAHQRPSQLTIEALEDSEILVISRQDKDLAYATLPALDRLFRRMTEQTHVALQRRLLDALGKTADRRYVEFRQRYPTLVQRLSNIQVAAYLGISHEFLSKIRRKITTKV
ncbi:Crp/Fnr family transcriptional regulator [Hymenobacter sp. H14-R3]|uniref:Crp/Fnr family transcriptional regulator n=1 Tax=Hymenobacter sp. H14-R3 TaxID=3046308 RepID=UPI0024BB25AC|nr:Crp/Fnr family transcriptional regulator [Hymenobacter sp. H14-R3]MDJ0367804.1 Crp/Fnr family transcriptional regulator [Hymenobacter sp. H14-R3]